MLSLATFRLFTLVDCLWGPFTSCGLWGLNKGCYLYYGLRILTLWEVSSYKDPSVSKSGKFLIRNILHAYRISACLYIWNQEAWSTKISGRVRVPDIWVRHPKYNPKHLQFQESAVLALLLFVFLVPIGRRTELYKVNELIGCPLFLAFLYFSYSCTLNPSSVAMINCLFPLSWPVKHFLCLLN